MLLQYPKGNNSRQASSLLTASLTPLSHYQPHLTLLFPTICLILLTLFSLSVSFYLLYSHYLSHSTFFLPTICLTLQYFFYSHYQFISPFLILKLYHLILLSLFTRCTTCLPFSYKHPLLVSHYILPYSIPFKSLLFSLPIRLSYLFGPLPLSHFS